MLHNDKQSLILSIDINIRYYETHYLRIHDVEWIARN